MCCSRKYPPLPTPLEIPVNLHTFLFETPLPLGISNELGVGMDIFWNHTICLVINRHNLGQVLNVNLYVCKKTNIATQTTPVLSLSPVSGKYHPHQKSRRDWDCTIFTTLKHGVQNKASCDVVPA